MVIEEHGEAASFHAAQRADELLEAGDVEGQRVWLRIYKAVLELGGGSGAMN